MIASLLLPFDKGVRLSGILILAGFLIELVTLFWSHPTSIIWYMAVGLGLLGVGTVHYIVMLFWGKRET